MITRFEIRNFGPLDSIESTNLDRINLVIGGNGSGKTFLLKSLYSAIRTLEEYKRGADQRSAQEILAEKLYWTFQPEKIGDLVTKNAAGSLSFRMWDEENEFSYSFGKDTTKQIATLENPVSPRTNNSIFLPAKEVLSLIDIILKSREVHKDFGFDDTYLDLARALRQSGKKGNNFAAFTESKEKLAEILGGRVRASDEAGTWLFQKGNHRFPPGVTAEGVKKIAILDTLLTNRYLDTRSIVFIDEIESALHPTAISKVLDIIAILAKAGMQFVIASHSYFVVKKLFLIAQASQISIPVISSQDAAWQFSDLRDGMPDNPIISESIRLYEQEVSLALQ